MVSHAYRVTTSVDPSKLKPKDFDYTYELVGQEVPFRVVEPEDHDPYTEGMFRLLHAYDRDDILADFVEMLTTASASWWVIRYHLCYHDETQDNQPCVEEIVDVKGQIPDWMVD